VQLCYTDFEVIEMALKEIQRTRPRNETNEHNTLKEVGKYLLFMWGCRIIGTEVRGLHGYDDDIRKSIMTAGLRPVDESKTTEEYYGKHYKVPKTRVLPLINKGTADVVGVKLVKDKVSVICIEAKASLSDYKNGFCYGAERTYVIAPKGVIPVECIHKNVGLIEVDLENFKLVDNRELGFINGVNIVKNARRRLDARFKNNESYQVWAQKTAINTAKRCTNELLFWNNKIPIYKQVYNRKENLDDIF
jgi:hypothetical protein